jgi:hypothetical protein
VVKSLHEGFIIRSISGNIGSISSGASAFGGISGIGSISSGASAFGGISGIGYLVVEHGDIIVFSFDGLMVQGGGQVWEMIQ